MSNKTNLFGRGTNNKLEEFRDNVLSNQSGGESVRVAILINPNQVIEFYTHTQSQEK